MSVSVIAERSGLAIEALRGAPVAPEGFRENALGLVVPEEFSRIRQVWTKDEYKALERAMKLVGSRKLRMFLQCAETAACRQRPLERIRNADGGITLRCACTDRIFMRKGL